MRHINWPYLVAFGQKVKKRLNLTVFENFMKWGAPITDFSECIFWLPGTDYNHFWQFWSWKWKKIHFRPQHAVKFQLLKVREIHYLYKSWILTARITYDKWSKSTPWHMKWYQITEIINCRFITVSSILESQINVDLQSFWALS